MAPHVTVVMPAYNAEPFIAAAIHSVIAQTWSDWELVVVDDGSTDDTKQILARFDDPRIRVHRQANAGEAAARNAALALARGEVVTFLDADDEWLPEHLASIRDHLASHALDGGVYTDGWYTTADGSKLCSLQSRRRGPFTGRIHAEVVRSSDVFGPPLCVGLRHSAIGRHRFDEAITLGTDWDFFTRIAENVRFGYIDRPTCLYRLHATNISRQLGHEATRAGRCACRLKAIARASFSECPRDVQVSVFYEVLVDLLRPEPERQAEVVRGSQFTSLARVDRARILRLMASKAILYSASSAFVGTWLRQSMALHPTDPRAAGLAFLHTLNPSLAASVLRLRTRREIDPLTRTPHADLLPASAETSPRYSRASVTP